MTESIIKMSKIILNIRLLQFMFKSDFEFKTCILLNLKYLLFNFYTTENFLSFIRLTIITTSFLSLFYKIY